MHPAPALAVADTPTGARLQVRVMPRASRQGIDGIRNGRLIVRVAAPPVEGAANAAAVEAIAQALTVPRGTVRLVSGHASRNKTVDVSGLTADEVCRRLASEPGPGAGSTGRHRRR
jgi:hypothetical protein